MYGGTKGAADRRSAGSSRTPRLKLIGGLVALATTIALSASALAATPYSVALKLPGTVKEGKKIKLTAAGQSSNDSKLSVFVSTHACAKTAKAETTLASSKVVSGGVVHHFSKSASPVAKAAGEYFACAYLTSSSGKSTYAHASKKYEVLAPKPPSISLVVTPGNIECSAVSFNLKVSDEAILRDVNVNLGDGFVYDVHPNTYTYEELYQEGYPSSSSWTATATATDANGLKSTVSKTFTAPPC